MIEEFVKRAHEVATTIDAREDLARHAAVDQKAAAFTQTALRQYRIGVAPAAQALKTEDYLSAVTTTPDGKNLDVEVPIKTLSASSNKSANGLSASGKQALDGALLTTPNFSIGTTRQQKNFIRALSERGAQP